MQIFPYINEFLSDLHVTADPKKIGFYSGLVVGVIYACAFKCQFSLTAYQLQESIFAIFQLVAIYNTAKLSGK